MIRGETHIISMDTSFQLQANERNISKGVIRPSIKSKGGKFTKLEQAS